MNTVRYENDSTQRDDVERAFNTVEGKIRTCFPSVRGSADTEMNAYTA